MTRIALVLIACFMVLVSSAPRAQDADRLLKAAMNTELVDGNLQAAIEQYKKVVQAGSRALAAQALVRMAECYQKMGDAQARKIYEQLVREYADQKESAAIARARLGEDRLAKAPAMALRKVWAGPNISDVECAVSSNGRYITCPAWETGDLGVHDTVTGTDRLLTTNNWARNEFAQFSAISKDSRQVAYSWHDGKDRYHLRVMSLTAPEAQPRVLFDSEDISFIVPSDWSHDGESIVVRISRKDRSNQIGLVSVKDGSLRVLKTVQWNGWSGMFLSPDGKYVGVDLPVEDAERAERDVFVLAVDGSRETPVVSHPGRDLMMGWSPDGRHLLFASDRGAAPGLWALPMSEGRPAGAAFLVKSEIAPASLGVTSSGALFVVARIGIQDVQVASVDFDNARLAGPLTSVVRSFVGSSIAPEWSPDGSKLAFVSVRNGSDRTHVIVIKSFDTGKVRELDVAMSYFGPIRWSPDGRSFLVKGTDLKGTRGIHQINAETGEVTRLPFTPGPCGDSPEWSPDGSKIYFWGGTDCPSRKGASFLLEVNLATAEQREVLRDPSPRMVTLSPDGRFRAGMSGALGSNNQGVVLIPVSGGEPKELLRFGDGEHAVGLSWTPDGRNLLVSVQDKAGRKILIVPTAGGPARRLQAEGLVPSFGSARVHPNGQQIAFPTGETKNEVWVLENFLPAVSASK